MSKETWMLLGFGIIAYLIYQNQIGSSLVSASGLVTPTYIPQSNAQGNEFQCPQGTSFYSGETSVNGAGYCA